MIAALFFAAFAIITFFRKQPPGTIDLTLALILEVAVLAQVVVAIVLMVGGDRPVEFGTFIGYLVASVLILPLAMLWGLSERSRWSSLVLTVAFFVLIVVVLRMQQTWLGPGV